MEFLSSFYTYLWMLVFSPEDWFQIPLGLLGLTISSLMILGVASIPLAILYNLLILFLFVIQRVLKINFPLVGHHIEKTFSDAKKRADDYTTSIAETSKDSAAALFKFRVESGDLPNEEDTQVFVEVLNTPALSLFDECNKIVSKFSIEDMRFYRERYRDGKLTSEFNNWKYYNRK